MEDCAIHSILVATHDPVAARQVKNLLERHRYQCETAASGEEFLSLARRGGYSLYVVEWRLPDMECGRIFTAAEVGHDITPIIVLSSVRGEQFAVKAMKMGACDYIRKDAKRRYLGKLLDAVNHTLQRQKSVDEIQCVLTMIQESEERYRNLVELSPEGIMVVDHGVISYVNPSCIDMLSGFNSDQIVGKNIADFVPEHCLPIFAEHMELIKNGSERAPWIEEKMLTLSGDTIDVEFCGIPFVSNQQGLLQVIFKDITRRKALENNLVQLAHYDQLTGLPNRIMFDEHCKHAMQYAERYKSKFAVLFIDLDRFKAVNDTHGHDIGDILLKKVSSRLVNTLRRNDVVARIGGDEFLVILAPPITMEQAHVAIRRIIAALTNSFSLTNTIKCTIGASIGASVYPDDEKTVENLIKMADIAMYWVKKGGRNGYQFFQDRACPLRPSD